MKKHGEEVLSVIKEVCCDLGLPLDSVEKPVVVDSQKLPNAPNEGYEVKATPAKIEAWRMWQEMGMPMSKIAVSVFCVQNIYFICTLESPESLELKVLCAFAESS